MRALLRKKLRELRAYNKATLLQHCESRLATLSKRSVKEQNIRNEANDRDMKVDFSRLNQESLAYLASVLNRARRD
jgi:hypothetical protein